MGVLQQDFSAEPVGWEAGDAEGCRDGDLTGSYRDRAGEHLLHLCYYDVKVSLPEVAPQYDDKFVPMQAGNGIGKTQRLGEPGGKDPDYLVTSGVSQGINHPLESIHADIDDGGGPIVTAVE